ILAVAGYSLWLWETLGSQQMAANWVDPNKNVFRFTSLAFTPTGEILLAGGSDGTVSFWNPWTHSEIGTALRVSQYGSISGIAFSPDGATFATEPHRLFAGFPEPELLGAIRPGRCPHGHSHRRISAVRASALERDSVSGS